MVFLATDIPMGQSLIIALTGYATIFVVLIVLLFLLKGLTALSGVAEKSEAPVLAVQEAPVPAAAPAAPSIPLVPAKGSEGEIKLNNVDEKTAALVMAVVADELKAPLNELRFKSIRKK